ncbi:GNAT family N-acetyltransferase, partial [Levilactobacillus zymae]|uniref:GNAT family N-acetyltransferase n=1 Tax=Levilactobacillus zymae TaxID=267363 RepID=UPI003FCD8BD0
MMGGFQDGQLVAAGRVTQGEQPDYRDVPWTFSVADEDVAILHLFAVHPDFRGQGVSSAMLQAILKTLRNQGRRVVHLDVMAGNLPAEKLYVANYKFNPNKPGIFQWQSVDDVFL